MVKTLFINILILISLQANAGSMQCQALFGEAESKQAVVREVKPEVTREQREEYLKSLHEAAFEVLKKSAITSEQAQKEIHDWFQDIQTQQQSGQPLTVMQHVTLMHLMKTEFLKNFPEQNIVSELPTALENSWYAMTGRHDPIDVILESRLPNSVLRKASYEEVQFHNAVFVTRRADSKTPIRDMVRDYVPRLKDKVMAVGLLAFGFSHTGRELLAAGLLGLFFNSVSEYLSHGMLGHNKDILALKDKPRNWFQEALYQASVSHLIGHHANSFKKQTVKFETEKDQRLMEERMERYNARIEDMVETDHGLELGRGESRNLMIATASVVAPIAYMMGFDLPGIATMTAVSVSWVPHLNYLHKYAHMTREEALDKANVVERFIINSRYFSMVSRMHAVHHIAPNSNINMMPNITDAIMKKLRKPTISDLVRMRELGMFF